jgi:hypothetical protein
VKITFSENNIFIYFSNILQNWDSNNQNFSLQIQQNKFETSLPQCSSELKISKEKMNPMPKLTADARRAG